MDHNMNSDCSTLHRSLQRAFQHTIDVLAQPSHDALPDPHAVAAAQHSLYKALPASGIGLEQVTSHLTPLASGFSGSSLSPTYYGFITGGLAPAARVAEVFTSLYDQNVGVHMPDQSIVTAVEDRALEMLLQLLKFDPKQWPGRILTTGATAGNIQGLACGREWAIEQRLGKRHGVAELGLLEACRQANIDEIKILTTIPHSSLAKAASFVGLGRSAIIDVASLHDVGKLAFDLVKVEKEMSVAKRACIVVISCGEVNTGRFATHGKQEVQALKSLCERHDAWLHVDGAFGIFARMLDEAQPEYRRLASGAEGLDLADSIGGDGHKLLNVPYDCGFFFCRSPAMQNEVFHNPNAVYLSGGASDIPSPLNIGAENSRRFRGLALYANLVAYGRLGYQDMLIRQVQLARAVASFVSDHEELDLLPHDRSGSEGLENIFMVVLFQAKDESLNQRLTSAINAFRKIFVSGTSWDGRAACRIAISNWQVSVERDFVTITDILSKVVKK